MLKKYQKSVEEVGIRYKKWRGKYEPGCREGTNFFGKVRIKILKWSILQIHEISWIITLENLDRRVLLRPAEFYGLLWCFLVSTRTWKHLIWTYFIYTVQNGLNKDFEEVLTDLSIFVRAALIRWSASISPPQRHDLMWTRSLSFW